jgi:hypothetical protein
MLKSPMEHRSPNFDDRLLTRLRTSSCAKLIGTALILAAAGCSTSMGRRSVLVPTGTAGSVGTPATQPLPGADTVLGRNVSAQDCAQNLLGIPLGKSEPNLNEAVTLAVGRVPGGLMLTNVSIVNRYMISGLFNVDCIRVTGDVVGK